MSGKAIGLFFLLLAACARPTYISPAGDAENRGQQATACAARFASDRCLSFRWEKFPTETDFGSLIFKTTRENLGDGSAVPVDPPGDVAVVLWMPGMGHGSSPVTVERLDVGTYRASRVFFTMRGSWELRFQLKSGNGIDDQAIVALDF